MRLDVFLKTSRLIPRRSLAQEFCDAGLIRVNGVTAKSSKDVSDGDEIEIKRRGRISRLVVKQLPSTKQVSKDAATSLYEVLAETKVDDDLI